MSIVAEIKSGEKTISDLIKNKTAKFLYYRANQLIYETSDGLEFSIPIEDTGEGTFFSQHQAIELMRWIRKRVEMIKAN